MTIEETLPKFGRYEIRSELGRGGMATVFHAYDPSFERDVAIKVLPPAFLHDPQLRVRFEREAKMIASLEHPAIVPVYDFGDEGGQPYIVMRYMSGGSLADKLTGDPLPLGETARIITRLAPALDAAHARGIIHRDLKPGNVLFDQYGNAFLSDFGIARLAQQESATLTGSAIVGTPAFMSPEQVQGEKSIDGRSDIYAVGVLVFQMLTGQAPYKADTAAKVMLMHLLEPVPDILQAKSDLPTGCEPLIQRAMAKDPDDRYPTTEKLAVDLERIADHNQLADQTIQAQAIDKTLVASKPPPPQVGSAAATMVATPRPSATPVPLAPALPTKRSPMTGILIVVGVLVVVLILIGGFFAYTGTQGKGPLAMLAGSPPTATLAPTEPVGEPTSLPENEPTEAAAVIIPPETPTPSPTTAPPTEQPTEMPTPTDTPEPRGPVIGGADKVAYLNNLDIWVANLDGSDLQQLTTDGAQKTSLAWTPDGQAITYVTAKCIQMVHLADKQVEDIACFNYADSLKQFEPSPDGLQAAITLDNQLYLVPYDIEVLKQAEKHSNLTEMATCKDFAPYLKNFITMVRWSADSNVLAARLIANLGNGLQGDAIQLFRVDSCIPNPRAIDNFPKPRFDLDGYDKNAQIQNYSWDGSTLFALNSIVRNDGFGHLYIYHSELMKDYPKVDPVDGLCCYRDPYWSPDGTHLLFAFQSIAAGAGSTTQLYLIPYGSIGSGATYTPIPVPDISNPKEWPMPILRPAQ